MRQRKFWEINNYLMVTWLVGPGLGFSRMVLEGLSAIYIWFVCVCVRMSTGVYRALGCRIPMEMELQVIVSHPTCPLRAKLMPLWKAVQALNHWAISLVHTFIVIDSSIFTGLGRGTWNPESSGHSARCSKAIAVEKKTNMVLVKQTWLEAISALL